MADRLQGKTAVKELRWDHVLSEAEIPSINFRSVIAHSSPDVNMPVRPNFETLSGPYADELNFQVKKMLGNYLSFDLLSIHKEFVDQLQKVVSAYTPVLSQYDKEVILPSTCALSVKRQSHFDIDETGQLGKKREWKPTEVAVDALYRAYRINLKGVTLDDAHLSLPRGKNLGWPTPVSTRSRADSDALLGIHVLWCQAAKSKGMSLSDAIKSLENEFGPSFAYSGYRLQHHGKPHLCCCSDGAVLSECFEPRSRAIYMSPKISVAWNRPSVKYLLQGIMNSPIHTQDRPAIQKRIKNMMAHHHVIALDVSKFDQNHGGEVGLYLLNLMTDLIAKNQGVDGKRLYEDFKTEFCTRPLIRSMFGIFLGPGGSILSSGVSMTSVMGCIASELIAYELASSLLHISDSASLLSSRGSDWDALTWGDDIVFSVSRSKMSDYEQFYEGVVEVGKRISLDFTAEPTIKFLGQNYAMLDYQGSLAYPVSRFLQNSFFPERVKIAPYTTVGYIARISLLDSSLQREVHQISHQFQALLNIEEFDWQDREFVLRKILPVIQKRSDSIAALDDVLNIFSHGLDPDQYDGSFDSEAMEDLLAITRIDVSDPVKLLSDLKTEAKFANPRFMRYIDEIRALNARAIRDFCSDFHIGTSKDSHSPIY